MSGLQFAPGETDIAEKDFSPSVILFWLRSRVGVSSTRIVTRHTNSVLGLIPLGSSDATYPLANVAGVSASGRFRLGRLVAGIVYLALAVVCLQNAASSVLAVAGLALLILGAAALLNMFTATLSIQNNAGGTAEVSVSILEKVKLEEIREAIDQRLLADHALLRHNQHMQVQNQQLSVQQQQLNAQIMQQNAHLQTQQSPAPKPTPRPASRPAGVDPAHGLTPAPVSQPQSSGPTPKPYKPSY